MLDISLKESSCPFCIHPSVEVFSLAGPHRQSPSLSLGYPPMSAANLCLGTYAISISSHIHFPRYPLYRLFQKHRSSGVLGCGLRRANFLQCWQGLGGCRELLRWVPRWPPRLSPRRLLRSLSRPRSRWRLLCFVDESLSVWTAEAASVCSVSYASCCCWRSWVRRET